MPKGKCKYIDLAKPRDRAPDCDNCPSWKKGGFAFLTSETQKMINCEHVIAQRVVSLFFDLHFNKLLPWERVLRLLQTFAGVLQKKIRTRAVFKETPTNYISTERLQNVEFDKIMFCFGFCFPKAAEAVNSKMTD